mmetsp:Transcript_106088/g.236677  ORF Transcript_106088/g.236677 Transcript_106088/m.236677 type:complete len:234 (+) Transcript_106088:1646-2347(+)
MVVHINTPTSLDTYVDTRNHHLIFCDENLRVPEGKPLTAMTIASVDVFHSACTPHAADRLVLLASSNLLQVIASLEQDISNTCTCQPRRLELLDEHGRRGQGVNRIHCKPRLYALLEECSERDEEVLQVHGSSWLDGCSDTEAAVSGAQHYAAHAWRDKAALRRLPKAHSARNQLRLPTEPGSRTARLPRRLQIPLKFLLLLPLRSQLVLAHALRVHKMLLVILAPVGQCTKG